MDDSEVCTPLLAESDAQKNTSNAPYEGSVTDADKVLITNTDSTKVEGEFCLEHASGRLLAKRLAPGYTRDLRRHYLTGCGWCLRQQLLSQNKINNIARC